MMRIDSRLVRVVSCALAWALVAGSVQLPPSIAVAETVPPPATPAEPTVVRELTEARSETSREFLLSNGVVRGEYHSSPIHHRDATSGRFEPIDPTLVDVVIDGREVSANRAHSMRIVLPRKLDAKGVTVERGGRAVRIAPAHDVRCGEATPSADPVSMRSVSATERAYAAAFDGATLAYESRNSGLKESIVLPRAPKAAAWAFDLTLEGLAPQSASDGSILLRDATGTPVLRIPRPWMLDSSSVTPGGAYSDAVRYELAGAGSSWRLVVVADAAWLADPARVYPVMIDPTVELVTGTGAGADDTYISSANKSTNYVSHTLIWLNNGDPAANWTEYIYLQPALSAYSSLATKKAAGRAVVGARLKTYVTSAYFAHGGTYAGRMCVTSTAVPLGGITFNTYLQSPPMPQSTLTFAAPARTLVSGLYNTLDITAMTRHWQDMQAIPLARNKCTIQVFGGSNAHVGFNSGDNSTRQPIWEIDYAPIPIVALSTPPTTTPVLTSVPDAAWTYTEALGNPQTAFEVAVATAATDSAIATTIAGTGSATSSTLRLPSGPFTPGQTYHVKVRAASSPSVGVPALWSTWSPWGSFTLAPDAVGVPSVTTTASPGWFPEADVNGDGRNDARNDSNASGRGSVTMTWTAAAGADGYAVELWDGAVWREIATTTATSWTSAGAGLFPTDSAIASMSVPGTSSPFLPGTGLDLRDDPRILYATRGSLLPTTSPAYRLRVRSRLGGWTRPGEDAGVCEVTLDGRTRHVLDEPRHTTHPLGTIVGHDAAFGLDTGEITLDVVDLPMRSWGPDVSVTRHYSSASTATGLYAPGWRFGFEEALEVGTATTVWTDEVGERRTFLSVGGTWTAPAGCFSALAATTTPAGAAWALSHKGGEVSVFDASGRLCSRRDRAGNTAAYDWSGGDLAMTAANGQRIRIDMDAGRVLSAAWGTSAGTRSVSYAASATDATVTREPADAGAPVAYHYAGGRLTGLAMPAVGAEWVLAYGASGTTMSVRCISADGSPAMWREAEIDAGARSGVVRTFDGQTAYGWDALGTTAYSSEEGSAGLLTWHFFDVDGLPIREVGPTGLVTSRLYDGRGNVTSEIDASGARTGYVYDAADDCVLTTDARGSRTWRVFDAFGNVTVEDRELATAGVVAHSVDAYAYDGANKGRHVRSEQAISATQSAVTVWDAFDPVSGDPGSESRLGVQLTSGGASTTLTTSKVFNAFGDVLVDTDAMGAQTTYALDGAGRVHVTVDPYQTRMVEDRDGAGNVVRTYRQALGDAARLDWRETTYCGAGLPIAEVSLDGSAGVVSSVTHEYDPLGREVRSDDSAVPGVATTVYDARGNEVRSIAEGAGPAPAASTRTTVDALGQVSAVVEPGAVSAATTTSYTSGGEIAAETAPDGSVSTFEYGADGDLLSESEASDVGTATTGHEYDLGGRETTTSEPDGSATGWGYDLLGRQVSARVTTGPVSTTQYNTLGWVLAATDSDGTTSQTTYDPCGRATEEVRGADRTTHGYDLCGRETTTGNTDGSSVELTLDGYGRQTRRREFGTDGVLARDESTSYDIAGRVARTADAASGLTRTWGYEASGTVTLTETRGARAVSSVSDGTGAWRSSAATISGVPLDFSVAATDAAGRVTTMTSAAFGTSRGRVFDEAGRLIIDERLAGTSLAAFRVDDGVGGTVPLSSVITSGGTLAQAVSARLATAPPSTSAADPTTYRRNPKTGAKSAEDLSFAFPGRSEVASYGYTVDGRLAYASRNGTGAIYTYSYHPGTGWLDSFQVPGQDPVHISYETSTGRIVRAGDRRFTHDSLGRRVGAGPADPPSLDTTYTWASQRLVGFATTASVSASYAYDASGQRVRSVVGTTSVIASYTPQGGPTTPTVTSLVTTTSWDYDGIALAGLAAARSDGATWAVEYLRDGGGDLLAGAYTTSAGTTPFLIATTDRGDVRELLDADGRSFAFYAFDAYGNPVETTSTGTARVTTATAAAIAARQPLRYAGYVWDAHSRLYYCSQRYYDPSVAAFISKDPARADGEESAYQYCGGDPVGKVDPSGEWTLPANCTLLTHWWYRLGRAKYRDASIFAGKVYGAHSRTFCSKNPYLRGFRAGICQLWLFWGGENSQGAVDVVIGATGIDMTPPGHGNGSNGRFLAKVTEYTRGKFWAANNWEYSHRHRHMKYWHKTGQR